MAPKTRSRAALQVPLASLPVKKQREIEHMMSQRNDLREEAIKINRAIHKTSKKIEAKRKKTRKTATVARRNNRG